MSRFENDGSGWADNNSINNKTDLSFSNKKPPLKSILTSDKKDINSNNKKDSLTNENSKEQYKPKHVYLRTDVNMENQIKRKIDLKHNIEKRNKLRKNRDSDFNNSMSISSNSRNNKFSKIGNTNKNLYSSFVERKRRQDKNDYNLYNKSFVEKRINDNKKIPKIEIKEYGSKIIPKINKQIQNKRNNNYLYSYNTYNTNDIIKKRKNKKNENDNESKNYKILNTEENSLFTKKLDKNKSKIEKNRNNKSFELRAKVNPDVNKKIDLSLDKYKTINNSLITERVKKKSKIKVDKNIYKGPIDIKNLIVSDSIESIYKKVNHFLNSNQIKYWKLTPYKYSCCAKNMDKFFLEIFFISNFNNIKKNDISDDESKYENKDNNDSKNKYLFYLNLLLSTDINDIPNTKLLENVINYIQKRTK